MSKLPTRGIMSATPKQARTAALAHQRYWASIRTTLALCERSERVSGDILHAIKTSIRNEFENADHSFLGLLNSKHRKEHFALVGLRLGMSLELKKQVLDLPPFEYNPTKEEADLDRWLRGTTKQKQASWWSFRAGEAARFYSDLGWFPFFITLTVDPKKINPRELWEEHQGWQNYIKKLARISAKCCGVSGRKLDYISNRDYIAYFAQLEHGKSGVHDHVHALVWFRNIPESWKRDPNYHLAAHASTNRKCPPLESIWQWCDPEQRPAIYFWHAECVWQRIGHKIPVDENTGSGLILLRPELTGSYLSKYMSKEEKPWFHRPKATHGLGLERLTRTLKQLTNKELLQLARHRTNDQTLLVNTMISVPDGLLRSLAKQEIYFRTFRKMSFKELIEHKPKPFKNMQDSVNNGVRPWRLTSPEFSRWLLDALPPEKIAYSERTFLKALRKLGKNYEWKRKPVKTIGAMH
jgi:hypothetical protein